MNIAEMAQKSYDNAQAKGFWDATQELARAAFYAEVLSELAACLEYSRRGEVEREQHSLIAVVNLIDILQEGDDFQKTESAGKDMVALSKLALTITELGEAIDAVFAHDEENLSEELGDALIRMGDFAGGMGIDLEVAVERKMAINEKRPYLHGKNF